MKNLKTIDQFIKENILPRPYKKIKCLECGEDVCDNINYKIGHLYNKHNCKPSVDDYKAKSMLNKYFAQGLKESNSYNKLNENLESYNKALILLKKYDIEPQGQPNKSIVFEVDDSELEGYILTTGDNKYNMSYWDGKKNNNHNNIDLDEIEGILMSLKNKKLF